MAAETQEREGIDATTPREDEASPGADAIGEAPQQARALIEETELEPRPSEQEGQVVQEGQSSEADPELEGIIERAAAARQARLSHERGRAERQERLAQTDELRGRRLRSNIAPHMNSVRYGPFAGGDLSEEATATTMNITWNLSREGAKVLGRLTLAAGAYGASHLASMIRSALGAAMNNIRFSDMQMGGEGYAADLGDRIANPDDLKTLNVSERLVERFREQMRDHNVEPLLIRKRDGSVDFVLKAADAESVQSALDDVIDVPDDELDAQHEMAERARAFATDCAVPEQQRAQAGHDPCDLNRNGTMIDEIADVRNRWNARVQENGRYAVDLVPWQLGEGMPGLDAVRSELEAVGFKEGRDFTIGRPSLDAEAGALATVLFEAGEDVPERVDAALVGMTPAHDLKRDLDEARAEARDINIERARARGLDDRSHGVASPKIGDRGL